MTTWIRMFAAGILAVGVAGPALAAERLFVTVTGAGLQEQAMPLVLANQALDQGAEVRVLLCGAGGELALADYDAPDVAPRGVTAKQLLGRLMENGSTVEVCAIFLPNTEHEAGDLTDGIGVADPADVAAWMMTPGTQLLSQ
ncbi:MAG: hypothetical protein ACOCYE_01405 [Pseudomonadota bacterium]